MFGISKYAVKTMLYLSFMLCLSQEILLTLLCMLLFMIHIWNKPPHDKTNKMTECSAKTQISLGIGPVWSESSLCTQWVAKDPSFLHADSEDWSDWANAQADLSLHWVHKPFCWFCHEVAQLWNFDDAVPSTGHINKSNKRNRPPSGKFLLIRNNAEIIETQRSYRDLTNKIHEQWEPSNHDLNTGIYQRGKKQPDINASVDSWLTFSGSQAEDAEGIVDAFAGRYWNGRFKYEIISTIFLTGSKTSVGIYM